MEKGWVTVYVKEKAHANNSEIIRDGLVITGSRLNSHNVIPNTSIKIAAFCHMTVYSLVQIHKSYVTSVHFYQSNIRVLNVTV